MTTSSGSPMWPRGMWRALIRLGRSSAGRSPRGASVSITPGLTQVARMPYGAPSAASCRVIAITASLDAMGAPPGASEAESWWKTVRWLVSEPVRPAVDPTVTMRPRLPTR